MTGAPPPPAPTGEAAEALIQLDGEGYGEGWAVPAADEESGVLRGEFENLWPLQLVDLRDEEMMAVLFKLLRRLPQVPSVTRFTRRGLLVSRSALLLWRHGHVSNSPVFAGFMTRRGYG